MPYKSEAQRKYFHAAAERGDISKKTVAEFDKASKGAKLPERVAPAKPKKFTSLQQVRDHYKKIK